MVLRAQWPLGTIAQFFHFVAEEKKRRQKNKGILWLGYHRYPVKKNRIISEDLGIKGRINSEDLGIKG